MTKIQDDVEGRANEIEQQAAQWVARIDLRGTPEEWTALDAWLNTSPRHRAAFLRLSVAWRRADELKKLAPASGIVDPDLLYFAGEVVFAFFDERFCHRGDGINFAVEPDGGIDAMSKQVARDSTARDFHIKAPQPCPALRQFL